MIVTYDVVDLFRNSIDWLSAGFACFILFELDVRLQHTLTESTVDHSQRQPASLADDPLSTITVLLQHAYSLLPLTSSHSFSHSAPSIKPIE